MEGATLDRELKLSRSDGPRLSLATPDDDAEIRRLLRANPMRGRISLTLEREPDFFADARWPGTTKQTVIARHHGRLAAMGSCVVRDRYVNGESCRVGYLTGLRLDAAFAGRTDIVRRGYKVLRELQTTQPAQFYFTSIASDNLPARRLLERGLPGMPNYEFLTEFVTLVIPVAARPQSKLSQPVAQSRSSEVLSFLHYQGAKYQFAERWSEPELEALRDLGLQDDRWFCVREGGRILAAAALWDQRSFKQTVVRGYSRFLGLVRPAVNLMARALGRPLLPPVGSVLANGFISHLAVDPSQPDAVHRLIAEIRHSAIASGIDLLTLGLAAQDPRLKVIARSFPCRTYRSRLYLVHWPDIGSTMRALDGRCVGLEAALLCTKLPPIRSPVFLARR